MLKNNKFILSEFEDVCPVCGESHTQKTYIDATGDVIISFIQCMGCEVVYSTNGTLRFNKALYQTKKKLKQITNDSGNIASILHALNNEL